MNIERGYSSGQNALYEVVIIRYGMGRVKGRIFFSVKALSPLRKIGALPTNQGTVKRHRLRFES